MTYQDIIVFNNLGLICPKLERKIEKLAFSKISSLGIEYENKRFWCPFSKTSETKRVDWAKN